MDFERWTANLGMSRFILYRKHEKKKLKAIETEGPIIKAS